MVHGAEMKSAQALAGLLSLLLATSLFAGCGESASGPSSSTASPPSELPPEGGGDGGDGDGGDDACEGTVYESTWDAIQEIVFERHGCREESCHGSGAAGGLDLRPEVAYQNLVEAASANHPFPRVLPGDKDRSYLWLKLAAKTTPDAVPSGLGTPMPTGGLPAIPPKSLELLRRWIYGGAPEEGTSLETEELVDGCLPEIEPYTIAPLAPPAPGQGVQLVMPPYVLPASSEHEVCFASYYDISDQVPEHALVAGGERFRYWAAEMRQDPQSHHLLINRAEPEAVTDPDLPSWKCKVGDRLGETCDPLDSASCGEGGMCATDFVDGFACLNFARGKYGALRSEGLPGGSQASQSYTEYPAGVFSTMPVRGLAIWNSHAFNLTLKNHEMNARVNVYFAGPENADVQTRGIFDVSNLFSPSAPPFEEEIVCADYVLPQNAHLYRLGSHTHGRGRHFTAQDSDGKKIYESFIYNDPVDQEFDPPRVFDSEDPAERTITFCSLYNNGVNPDGSPNIETVTRYSRMPDSVFVPGVPGLCRPVACVNVGMIGEPCSGAGDDAACDSSPGAGDGWCDACRITGGESTENEMFLPLGGYYVPAL